MLAHAPFINSGERHNIPLHLTPRVYGWLQDRMLEAIDPERSLSGLAVLDDTDNPRTITRGREMKPGTISSELCTDFSLTRQLSEINDDPSGSTGEATSAAPQAYLMTAYSAIPIADAIRGFHEEEGAETPVLSYVRANRENAMYYLLSKRYIDPRLYSEASKAQAAASYRDEVKRLKELVSGAEHVCVVDQNVRYGATLAYAYHMLATAGVQTISAIRGIWYHDADPKEVSLRWMTSSHKPFMHEIGVLARQLSENQA